MALTDVLARLATVTGRHATPGADGWDQSRCPGTKGMACPTASQKEVKMRHRPVLKLLNLLKSGIRRQSLATLASPYP
jgi:hypothetical protein